MTEQSTPKAPDAAPPVVEPVTKAAGAPKSPSVPRPTGAAAEGQSKLSSESPAPVEAAAASAHPDEPAAGSETHDADIPNASAQIAEARVLAADSADDAPPSDVADFAPHIASSTSSPPSAGALAAVGTWPGMHAAPPDPTTPRVPEIPPDPNPELVDEQQVQQRIGIDAAPVVPVPHEVAVQSQTGSAPPEDEPMDDELQAGWNALMAERDERPSAKQAYLAGVRDGIARNREALALADLMAAEMDWAILNALRPRERGMSVLRNYQRARPVGD